MNLQKARVDYRTYEDTSTSHTRAIPISAALGRNSKRELAITTGQSRVGRLIERIFRGYTGNIVVRLWQGEILRFGSDVPDAILIFHDPGLIRKLILYRDPLLLADAYFQGSLDIQGDIYSIIKMKDHFKSLKLSLAEKMDALFTALQLGNFPDAGNVFSLRGMKNGFLNLTRKNSKAGNRKAIAFHYDVSNDFYKLWLDEKMVYSCAYFEAEQESLDQAQNDKLEHICRKLQLQPGDRLLDIGCGWGALMRWAVQHYDVKVKGVTLSREQYEYNLKKIEAEGLQDKISVELKDYRDLAGENEYDKIVSVGMFEHVGIKNLPQYFSIAQRLLKPGGLFLNHGITQDEEGWKKSVGTRFINRYVFPDGELDQVSNVQHVMEKTGFELLDVEALRPHYALTLRHWVDKLETNKDKALQIVSESTYRVWHLYMAACAVQFETGEVGVYQILASNRDNGIAAVPLTRRNLYN